MPTEYETLPLRFGSPGDYEKIITALGRADFTETAVCRMLGLGNLSDLNSELAANADLRGAPPGLALFIRLFLFFETVPRPKMAMLLDDETIEAFLNLDILRPAHDSAGEYYTSVFLYPVAGFYIASDRPVDPDGIVREPDDWVLPAIYEGTLKFLDKLITGPSDEALDLCPGTGIGAMVMSRTACKAVAVDITPRAAHYARFNRNLNGIDHLEILTGNLYEPVAGRVFDRIIAHPPYVPAVGNQPVFSDGGETGESVVRRIIEGLPEYLRPGGIYYSLSFNIDTQNAPFEERVRGWLGNSQENFDILFAGSEVRPIDKVMEDIIIKQNMTGPGDMAYLRQALEKIGATQFVYGILIVRRKALQERGAPCTIRTELDTDTTGGDLVKILENHRMQR